MSRHECDKGFAADVRLSEVNHRVANSFQFMVALIRLRLNQVQHPEARDQLHWVLDLIHVLGAMHKSAAAEDGRDFSSVLKESTDYWRELLKPRSIRIALDADHVDLVPSVASPLGLIVQELVTNSIKHAFIGVPDGLIRVELRRAGSSTVLKVSDNGRGFNGNHAGMGMKIIEGLSQQIGARFHIDGARGTTALVEIPLGKEVS